MLALSIQIPAIAFRVVAIAILSLNIYFVPNYFEGNNKRFLLTGLIAGTLALFLQSILLGFQSFPSFVLIQTMDLFLGVFIFILFISYLQDSRKYLSQMRISILSLLILLAVFHYLSILTGIIPIRYPFLRFLISISPLILVITMYRTLDHIYKEMKEDWTDNTGAIFSEVTTIGYRGMLIVYLIAGLYDSFYQLISGIDPIVQIYPNLMLAWSFIMPGLIATYVSYQIYHYLRKHISEE